jgi:hypothetical protein
MISADFARVSPGLESYRVAGDNMELIACERHPAGRTDADRRLSIGQVGVSMETPYLSSGAREALPLSQEVYS